METYLLSWNPKKWGWSDYKDVIADINSFGFATYSWSCGNRKNINVGDRIFLTRQGIEPRGIIGSGWAATTPKEKPHWNQELAQEDKTTLAIMVNFDVLLDVDSQELLHRVRLEQGVLQQMHWDIQASGVLIPSNVADRLEKKWSQLLKMQSVIPLSIDTSPILFAEEVASSTKYIEGMTKQITVNAYERNQTARLACLRYCGFDCAVCGFNFRQIYGELGQDFIHVHHLVPLSEIAQEYLLDAK